MVGGQLAASSSSVARWRSSSESVAAAQFSSRCATDEVPGIGSMTSLRCSSHASETCAASRPARAPRGRRRSRPREHARGDGELGDEADALCRAVLEHASLDARSTL